MHLSAGDTARCLLIMHSMTEATMNEGDDIIMLSYHI